MMLPNLPSYDPESHRKLMDKLKGHQDMRGPIGILSRGVPLYNGGSTAAHSGGGPQFGRPKLGTTKALEGAIARRLGTTNGN